MMLRLLPFFATLLARTVRIRVRGNVPSRAIVMFWHGKMFAGWYAVRQHHPIALISASKDGEILSSVLTEWRYKLVRGSSNKRGMEALEDAIAQLKRGEVDTLAITPDGPRGPRHLFKRGAFIAARETGLPLVMFTVAYSRSITLKSWDKFEVPLPFSRVDVTLTEIPLPTSLDDETLAELSRRFDA